jgi:IS30 family transposase
MDATFQAILDSLPPKEPRSKLEPYAELILELRRRERSYREIASILTDRCGVKTGAHTVYSFVRVRNQGAKKAKSTRAEVPRRQPSSERAGSGSAIGSAPDNEAEVRQRIADLKRRPMAKESQEKRFEYDASQPLQLIRTPETEGEG